MRGFPFSCPIELRYGDIDAMNHANNAVIVTYLETARLRLWQARIGFDGSASSLPFIVARVVVDYRSPISLGDSVEAGVGVGRIGRSSFSFVYRLEASGRLAAEAETVQVHYDYAQHRATPIDRTLLTKLEPLLLQDAGRP
jgi:acyl-CoA thioester hydrolase